MSSEFSITFYGCRGSFPVSGPGYQRYGGNTPCVSVRAAGRELILDAGSGLVALGADLNRRAKSSAAPVEAAIFISHAHLDHILGLPYFTPFHLPDASVWAFGPQNPHYTSFEATLDTILSPPYFPVPRYEMPAEIEMHNISEADVVYFVRGERAPRSLKARHPAHQRALPAADEVEVKVECLRGYSHPKCGVNFYRITAGDKVLVYATDTEGFVHDDRRLIEFSRGADVLIHDAMYADEQYYSAQRPTQGYGHSTPEIAARIAQAADVKQLILFHHDPANDDDALDKLQARAKTYFAATQMAFDGLKISL